MKAVVVGSGSLTDMDFLIEKCYWADLIIAADGGARYLYDAGLAPHILIGDFDSVPQEVLRFYRDYKGVSIIGFPKEKDFTDMELALDIAAEKGADEIAILAATGSRLDHSAANILLLYGLMKRNIKGCIEDANNRIILTDHPVKLKKQENWKVSLLSISPEVSKISTSGLMYPLHDFDLKLGSSRGISNEFTEDEAAVDFDKGLLMVVLSHEPNTF